MNKYAFTDAIKTARTVYLRLENFTDEQITREFNRAKKATGTLRWNATDCKVYTSASRIGETFRLNREDRKYFYAAICFINTERLKNIKAGLKLATNNAKLDKLEAACFYGADEANA